jgi:hypothetical protein
MAGHTSEKLWGRNKFGDTGIGDIVKGNSVQTLNALNLSEEAYQDLLELWSFAGGTDQLVADQLFFDVWSVRVSDPIGNPDVVDTQANAREVTMVADAKAAMLALHQLYEALTNVVVTQSDRISVLRRMT